jgi:hypothetical protein
MAIVALRAGGIVNVDGSSQAAAAADHGQSLSDAGAAQLVLSGAGTTGGQTAAFSQATLPLFLRADSAPVSVTDFHSDQPSTVSTGSAGLTLSYSSAGATVTMMSGSVFNTIDHAGDPSVTINYAALPADGWFIVPSAANEYGDAVYAAGDGFGFDVATGDFASDWVFIA